MKATTTLFSACLYQIGRKVAGKTIIAATRMSLETATDRKLRMDKDAGNECHVLVLCTGNRKGNASDCKVLNRLSYQTSSN